jgi:hypothetical protein
MVFITVVGSVHSVVWTDSLFKADYVGSFRRLIGIGNEVSRAQPRTALTIEM